MKKNTLLGILAYVTLFLAGIIKVINAIGLNLGTIGGVLAIICDCLSAYGCICKKSKTHRLVYYLLGASCICCFWRSIWWNKTFLNNVCY